MADSESVEELVEERNAFEAAAVDGVENARKSRRDQQLGASAIGESERSTHLAFTIKILIGRVILPALTRNNPKGTQTQD